MTNIFSKLVIEGLHQWKECPIESMSYLRNLHRHQFHIEVYVDVTRADESDNHRVIEFIELSHNIRDYINEKYFDRKYNVVNFGNMSVENIANELYHVLSSDGYKVTKIRVSEDDESGVEMTF